MFANALPHAVAKQNVIDCLAGMQTRKSLTSVEQVKKKLFDTEKTKDNW